MKWFGFFCFFWLSTGLCQAQSGQPGPNGEVPLRGKIHRLVDSTGQRTIQEVVVRQRAGQFIPAASQTNRQDFGYNETAVHWLFFELDGPVTPSQQVQLMLEIEYANLDELQLYAVSDDSPSPERITSLGLTGDRFLFRQRPYLNNNYVFPIRLRAGQKTGFYLRLNQPHAILSFFVRLWHRPAFLASDRTEYFLWGIYIGIICIVLVLNMVMLVALRDWIYGWYGLYLHFITMHLFSDSGLGFQYLWPAFPRLNEYMPVYLYVWAAMVTQTTFMQYFIHQNRHNSHVFRWVQRFKGLVLVSLGAVIAIQALPIPGRERYIYQVVSLATSCFVPVIMVLTILSLYERVKRGGHDRMVRYYAYALAVQFMGYSLVAFMNFCQAQGWPLPFDLETYVVLGLTVLTDLIFFTYGLSYRYNTARQHNQQLELSLLSARQDAQKQVINSLQDEHKRLAEDLHDDVGPLLATAKGYLSRLFRTNPAPPLQRAQTLLDEAADELRALSHQLLPTQLEQADLARAIGEATRKRTGRGVPVQFVSLGEVRPLGPQRDQLLFSMATQLIRNAQQHPHATEVTVQLLYHETQVNLAVEDDGLPTPLPPTDEANLRAKAALLRADLLIDTTDAGNSVMVSVAISNPVPA